MTTRIPWKGLVRDLIVRGAPILRKAGQYVPPNDQEIHRIVRDLWDTLHFIGASGLAANQIGETANVCVIKHRSMTLVNPSLSSGKGQWLSVEGCFSIPGYKACVPRFMEIKVIARRPLESMLRLQVIDDPRVAVVVQHEMDHLAGIFISDYVDESHGKKGGILIHEYEPHYPTAESYQKQLAK